ncbi:MAG: response regulator [Gammaproteobacteria bacterium]|nr:response regulator [Gammaproteobacteria bacterium]
MNKPPILLVDDEPTTLATMSRILSPLYQVRIANSGERALEVVMTKPRPELILLDVVMPHLSGFDVLQILQRNPATQDIPVLFVTSMEGQEDEEHGFALGAVDYLSKPIKPAILLARVKNHLTLKHALDFLHDKNLFLEAEIGRRMQENLVVQDASIRALAHLAEIRDPETGEHILRTQNYVRILSHKLRDHPRFSHAMHNGFIDMLAKSAPLHDIGKVGIPDQILLKPGKLTPAEYDAMKMHTLFGAQAIEEAERDIEKPVAFLGLAKEVARWHHERWDGRGYPDRLAGDSIPVSARLMAVADVFDALISKRSYKPAMEFSEARDIILAERGSHFDPDVADAFSSCFEQFVETARCYRDKGVKA